MEKTCFFLLDDGGLAYVHSWLAIVAAHGLFKTAESAHNFIATQAGLTAKSDKNYLKNRFYWSLPLKMMVGPEEAFERQVSGICTTQKKRPPLLEAALARPLDDLLVCF